MGAQFYSRFLFVCLVSIWQISSVLSLQQDLYPPVPPCRVCVHVVVRLRSGRIYILSYIWASIHIHLFVSIFIITAERAFAELAITAAAAARPNVKMDFACAADAVVGRPVVVPIALHYVVSQRNVLRRTDGRTD